MQTKRRLLLRGVNDRSQRRLRFVGLPRAFAMLTGILMLCTTMAQAIPVRVDSAYARTGIGAPLGVSATVQGFFDTSALTGVGTEIILLDAFSITFINPLFGTLTAVIPNAAGAVYLNGAFVSLSGTGIELVPDPFIGTNTVSFFGNLQLTHKYAITGRDDYQRISTSGPIAVPESGSLALFGMGPLGIAMAAVRRRR